MDILDIIYAKKFSGGSGGVSSWNDLTDKPFGEETGVVEVPLNITFDGDMTGKETIDISGSYLVKVSDIVLSMEELTGATLGVVEVGGEDSYVIGTDIEIVDGAEMATPAYIVGNHVYAVYSDVVAEGFQLTTGVWFVYSDDTAYPKSLYVPNVIITTEGTIIHPIEGKYLPTGTPWIEEGESAPLNIVFDGDITGKETFQAESTMVKVSDSILSADDLDGATLTLRFFEEDEGMTEPEVLSLVLGSDLEIVDANAEGVPIIWGYPYLCIVQSDFSADGETLTAGVYFIYYDEISHAISLTNPNAIVGGGTTIHKLDNRCLDLAWLPTATEGKGEVVQEETTKHQITQSTSDGYSERRLTVGETYIVTFDGVEYMCVAHTVDAFPALTILGDGGNSAQFANYGISDDGGNGEPFAIIEGDDPGVYTSVIDFWVDGANNDGTHTFAIHVFGAVPNKLPAEFLPDDATAFTLVSPNGTKYSVTVSDDGTLSATAI